MYPMYPCPTPTYQRLHAEARVETNGQFHVVPVEVGSRAYISLFSKSPLIRIL